MFSREMDFPLSHAFVTAEEGILPDEPAGVAAKQVGVAGWIAQGCRTRVVLPGSRPDLLQLFDEGIGILLDERVGGSRVGGVRLVRSSHFATRVVDNNTGCARLSPSDIPRVLEPNIGIDIAVAYAWPCPGPIPVARIELQLPFRVGTIAKLRDGRLLEAIEIGLAIV